MKRMNVCVVTGTRAEFGIWRPVLDALWQSSKLGVQLLVTGMHLLPQFGKTEQDIARQGYRADARVPMYKTRWRAGRVQTPADALATGIAGIARGFEKLRPDLVMVLGDRLEMLAAASAALACRLPIAHVHGGETAPGQWDEQIRHAITKMAHIHFCATPVAARRIVQMGENPKCVHIVGAPALDAARAFLRKHGKELADLNMQSKRMHPFLVLHPSSADRVLEFRRVRMVVDVLLKAFPKNGLQVIGPNNDPGHEGILKAYAEWPAELVLHMSLSQVQFWASMAISGLLVGNSSSGIIEAASFGVPVINIGERQAGRERSDNVIDVPWDGAGGGARGLERALRRVMTDKAFARRVARRKNVYGDGHASMRIVKVLEGLRPGWAEGGKRFWDG